MALTGKQFTNSLWRGALLMAAASLIAGLALAAFPQSALAAAPAQPPTPDGTRLEFLYRRLEIALTAQGNRLQTAADIADLVADWIDQLESEGKDVSSLRAALDVYNDKRSEAQSHHDEAAAIMAEHAGFDDAGEATDLEQARDTLRSTVQALRDAHRALVDGTITLRRAFQDFRAANNS